MKVKLKNSWLARMSSGTFLAAPCPVLTVLKKAGFHLFLIDQVTCQAEGPNPFRQKIAPIGQICGSGCVLLQPRKKLDKNSHPQTTMPEPRRYLAAHSGSLASGRAIQDLTCKV